MAVTIFMFFVVFVVSLAAEIRIVLKWPWVYRLVKRNTLAGMALSIFLSMTLGFLIGLQGFIAAVAGLAATIVTGIIYAAAGYAEKNADTRQFAADFKRTYSPVFKLVKFLFAAMTLPIWLPVKLHVRFKGHAPA